MRISTLLADAKLYLIKARLKRVPLTVRIVKAYPVRAERGNFQLDLKVSGIPFTALLNRDVLLRLTPKMHKATNEARFAEVRRDIGEILLRKARAREFGAECVIYVGVADL